MDQKSLDNTLLRLIADLQRQPQTLEQLWVEHAQLWQSLNFNQHQVALWLAALPASLPQAETSASYQAPVNITEHIVILLKQQANGRMLLASVLKKLPVGVTVTEQHIRRLAQQDSVLAVKGPFLVLNSSS
jgi:hypothetical protein